MLLTWAEVIGNAKARLKFYQDQLQYQASEKDVQDYLIERHEQFLPVSFTDNISVEDAEEQNATVSN